MQPLTTQQFIQKIKHYTNISLIGKYVNSTTPVKIFFKKCGHIVTVLPYTITKKKIPHCPKCPPSNTLTHHQFLKLLHKKRPKWRNDFILLGAYKARTQRIQTKCKFCGKINMSWPRCLLAGNTCKCRTLQSTGERFLRHLFKQYNIKYHPEHTFKDCRDQRLLRFDFYLPEFNYIIEYHGVQHYRPTNLKLNGDALAHLKITQKHDNMKKKYLKMNKIPLIVFNYKTTGATIEDTMITFFLQKHKKST